ncbi:MAG: hypothetical protein J1G30_04275 [Spirochaetales bacterium]|nr:hypothetical protein [Spirochaetales bacterium]
MITVASTPVAGIVNLVVDIEDKDVFLQEKKDEFDLHSTVTIYHGKFGFAKKVYFLDSIKTGLKKVKFEESEKGCGTASLEFDYIDTYIQPDDIVRISSLDRTVYQGRVLTITDKKVEVQPARAKLSELRYKGKFNKYHSALDMIETILDERNLDSGVEFNDNYIDTVFYAKMESYFLRGDMDIDYELISDIIDRLITDIDSDAVWGVNAVGAFFVKYPETATTQYFYKTLGRCDYAKITVAESWDNIEYTRAAVTRAGRKFSEEEKENNPALIDEEDTVFCGLVGYESSDSYPPLPRLENLVGKKEALIHLSTMLTSDTIFERNKIALDYAYSMITSQSTDQKITLTKVPFRPEMSCGQKAYVQHQDKSILVLSDCSTADSWYGARVVESSSVAGEKHIEGEKDLIFYLERDTQYIEQDFFVFFARFSGVDFFSVDFRDRSGQTIFSRRFQIVSLGWQQFTIPYTKSFRSIRFYFPGTYALDMLQVYCRNDKVFSLNINKITTTITSGIGTSQVELGSKNVTANDALQQMEWKFRQIDKINSI